MFKYIFCKNFNFALRKGRKEGENFKQLGTWRNGNGNKSLKVTESNDEERRKRSI